MRRNPFYGLGLADEFNPFNDPNFRLAYGLMPDTNKRGTTMPEKPMTEEEFEREFKPLASDGSSILWEMEQVMPLIESGEITDNNVWTAVETDSGMAWAAGWHVVNRFAYLVTQVPWISGTEVCDVPDEEG